MKLKRLFSRPALVGSMPAVVEEAEEVVAEVEEEVDEEAEAEEEEERDVVVGVVVCEVGCEGSDALWALRMKDLVMERAAWRPWGCWKTSDRSAGASSEGWCTGRPGSIVPLVVVVAVVAVVVAVVEERMR